VNLSWAKPDERWYLGVRCRKCHLPILFALDRNDGQGQPVPTGKLVLTCAVDSCKHQADYTAAAVSRFQKQPAQPAKPARPSQTVRNHENSKGRQQKRRA
jgi:hypothetical protein